MRAAATGVLYLPPRRHAHASARVRRCPGVCALSGGCEGPVALPHLCHTELCRPPAHWAHPVL